MIIKKYCIPLLCAFSATVITVNAQSVMLFVKNALLMCYNNIIPSLFVFMVLSSYMGQGRFTGILSLPFLWYGRLLKIKDNRFPAFVLLSLTGGFAVGANFLNQLQRADYEKNCLYAISPVLINNSFSFCVFAVGIGMLDNYYLGLMLFVSLAVASLITGFVFSFVYEYNIVSKERLTALKNKSFVECVNSSVSNILSICGYVIIFYVLCKVLSLYIHSKSFLNILSSILEVTCGCSEIALNSGKNPYFICMTLSIVPVSTLCQVYYFTRNRNIVRSLIVSRIIHTPVSLIIFTVLCNLFPVAASAVSPQSISIKYFYNTSEISAVLFMLVLAFTIIYDRNKLFTKSEK